MDKNIEDTVKNYYAKMEPIEKARTIASHIGWWYFSKTEEAEQIAFINETLNPDLPPEVREFWTNMGYKLQGEAFRKSHAEIRNLGITRIVYDKGVVTITLSRPGLIIGEKGKIIDELTKVLSKNLHEELRIKLEEENVVDALYVWVRDY